MVDPGSGSQREVADLMLTRYAIALPLSLEPTSSWIQAPQTRPIAAQHNALSGHHRQFATSDVPNSPPSHLAPPDAQFQRIRMPLRSTRPSTPLRKTQASPLPHLRCPVENPEETLRSLRPHRCGLAPFTRPADGAA
jgi:hypothetical protein